MKHTPLTRLALATAAALLGACGGGHDSPSAQVTAAPAAPQVALAPRAHALGLAATGATLNLDDIDRGTFCYAEPVNLAADVSDLKAAFNGSNWLPSITGVYARRWPSGKALAEAQADDQYFKGFVDTSSFNKLSESLMVAIHEETHMWDLASSRSQWNQFSSSWITNDVQFMKFNFYDSDGGFPRKEILPLITDDASSETDNVYLKDAQQGEYHLNGVTAELNASLMGLPAATAVAEFIDGIGASNSRNVALTNLSYLQLYLRVAKAKYPAYYAKLKADPVWRRYVLVQFLRTAYWTAQSDRWAAKLGSDKVPALVRRVHASENRAILEDLSGYALPTTAGDACMGGASGLPVISGQPASISVTAGQAATFTVQASGTGLSYQWRRQGTPISGATAASYTLANPGAADDGALFSVVVSNSKGSVTSGEAKLSVKTSADLPPVIGTAPAAATVAVGQTATFSVTASGSGPLSYQWRKNGSNIPGATGASYTTLPATAADNGARFSVTVSNAKGSVTSADAILTVKSGGTNTTGVLQAGGRAIFPGGTTGYHQSLSGGTFSASLAGPSGANFNLYLYKWSGSAWTIVAKSEGAGATESLSYQGGAGYYYLEVRAVTGSGNYSLSYVLAK